MHKFLKAAGFSAYDTEKSVYDLLKQKVARPENLRYRLILDDGSQLREYRLPVNPCVGLCAVFLALPGEGEQLYYYYPYYNSYSISSSELCILERHTATETYEGIIDEYAAGLSMIFFVNNPMLHRHRYRDMDESEADYHGVDLTAFANEGMVLLPTAFGEELFPGMEFAREMEQQSLIDAARNGDEDAMDTLNEADLAMYKLVQSRMEDEDLYSVVEQSFMPSGAECDQYSVIAEILEVNESINDMTREELWLLRLNCNSVDFYLCIRKDDLLGVPEEGRRIKSRIWMQGRLE